MTAPDRAPAGLTPIRVTQLASGDLWAGAEVQLYNMALALKQEPGVAVDVVLFNHGVLADRLRAAGVELTVLDEQALSPWKLLRALVSHLRERRTGVLHTHRFKENVLGSFASWAVPGMRTLRTVHGAPEYVTAALNLKKRIPEWLDWLTARWVQYPIVCVSEQLRDLTSRSLPASRLRVVSNGIDIPALMRAAEGDVELPGPRRWKVGFFGRMVPVKRVDLIVEVARRVEQARPGQFAFYLFGDGPLREEVERQAGAAGVQDWVHSMGFTDTPAPYLRAMDLLLLTSDHEGLPMIVLEAMALGVHVVSHAVGAIPDVMEQGRAGTLVASQDPAAYVTALLAAMDDRDGLALRRTAAMERVTQHYSATSSVRQYLGIYRERSGA